MADPITYYINNSKRTVTAVVTGTFEDITNKLYNIVDNTKNSYSVPFIESDWYSYSIYYYSNRNKNDEDQISSTITAEPDVDFNKDTIERLKYIAKCSVKKKYHERLIRYMNIYNEVLKKITADIDSEIKHNKNVLDTHPFVYTDPEDWERIKEIRRGRSTAEI